MARFALSPSATRMMLDSHSLLGVIFGALVYLVCISGTVSVLSNEFAVWEAPSGPTMQSVTAEQLAAAGAAGFVRAEAEGVAHDLFVFAPTAEFPRLGVMGFADDRHLEWHVDETGALHTATTAPWTEFMREHHHNLHVPAPYGGYLVGIIGTLLLASLFSGVIAHRRILKDAFRLRLGGSPRLANADLHNRVGVWALPFHLIVSLTGSLLGLAGLIIGLLALVAYGGDQEKAVGALLGPQPTEDSRPAPLPDILPMIARIEAATPGARIASVQYAHAGTMGQTISLATAEPGRLAQNEAWTFAADGTLLAKAGFTDGTLGMRIYGMITPLHFGTYGGIALKLIYVVLGTGLSLIVATGFAIWLARRRDAGRASARLESLWSALVWGQLPAFALSALLSIQLAAGPLPVYWAIVLLWLAAAAHRSATPANLRAAAQAVGGAALLLLAGTQLARYGLPNPQSSLVTILLIFFGIAALWHLAWRAVQTLGLTIRRA